MTPAYNAEKFISYTLRSVMHQSYSNIQHIVIDDGSTDNTVKILEKYRNRYNLNYFSKPNEGQTITVNKGFDLAEGSIVVWLNADDVLFDKYVIEEVVEKFSTDSKVDVVYGHTAIIDENNRLIKIQCAPPRLTYAILLQTHPAACVFYKKEIVKKYKLNASLNYVMDYEQCLKMCRDGINFGFLNKVLIGWRRHKATKSLSKKAEVELERIKVVKKYDQKSDVYNCFRKYFTLYPYLYVLKLLGISKAVKCYTQRNHLAFDANFDFLLNLIFRQAIPFVT
ncbi:MAG: glycosyltransferase [Candidatus Bathyarchaeia archaeon]